MSRGEALDDRDRLPWLAHLRETGLQKLDEEVRRRGSNDEKMMTVVGEDVGVVLVCSSLKRFYRQILRGKLEVKPTSPEAHAGETSYELGEVNEASLGSPLTSFVWVKGDKETLRDRMVKRRGHFFKAKMLDSQFDVLEPPEGEPDVVVVPIEPSTEEQTDMVLEGLKVLTRDGSAADSK